MPINPKSPERRREQIREAALALFMVKGFQQTTMRDIAQAFGMSVGHLYNYYPNKESIVKAIVEGFMNRFISHMQALSEEPLPADPLARDKELRKQVETVVALFVSYESAMLTMHMLHEGMLNPVLLERIRAMRQKVLDSIVTLFYKDCDLPEETCYARAGVYYSLLQGARLSLVFNPNQDMDLLRTTTGDALLHLLKSDF